MLVLALLMTQALTAQQEQGKGVFQACSGCHNTLTDARKSGPSLRTLFGKVRLANGKRVTEDSVSEVIIGGYNAMPSYRNMFSAGDQAALLAYLKTLRARPEVGATLKPIRGADNEVLKAGEKHFEEHCQSCHATPEFHEAITELSILPRIRDGHSGMMPTTLEDETLFRLLAYLKAAAAR